MSKSDELFGLHKVPDDALIRQLLIERGKNLSYIEELEEELGRSGGCAKCRAKEEHIRALEKKNRKLEEKASREEDTFKAHYYTLLRKYEVLEKQILRMVKTDLKGMRNRRRDKF